MAGPTSRNHCEASPMHVLEGEERNYQLVNFSGQLVTLYARVQYGKEEPVKLIDQRKAPANALLRHEAAQLCALTILENECPLFVFEAQTDDKGHIVARKHAQTPKPSLRSIK